MSTNDFSNQMVSPKYVFGSLMRRDSFACAMAPLLSQYKGIGLTMLGTTPNCVMNFHIQTASLAALEDAMHFDLVMESPVVSCLELFQLIVPLFNVNT